MNSVQVTVCFRPSGRIIPCVIRPQMSKLHPPSSHLCSRHLRVNALNMSCLKLNPSALRYQRFRPLQKCNRNIATKSSQKTPVCLLLSGEDELAVEGEGSPGKGMGNINKGLSIEDVLRQQIEKGEYYEDLSGKDEGPGGRDGNPGGGGGGGGGRSRGSGDEGSPPAPDEPLQAVLATFAFIFLYMFIITGDEYLRLTKDYFRYLLGGEKSVRLRRFIEKWENFLDTLTEQLRKEDEDDKHRLLEKAIVNTTTFYDSPEKYRAIMGGSKSVRRRQDDDDDDERSDERSDSDEQRSDSDEGYDF